MPGWIAAMEQLGNGLYNSLMNNRHVDIIPEEVQLRFLRLAKNEFLWCDLDLDRNYTISSTIEVDKGNEDEDNPFVTFRSFDSNRKI